MILKTIQCVIPKKFSGNDESFTAVSETWKGSNYLLRLIPLRVILSVSFSFLDWN
jgi:hypothetical protein